MADLEEFRVNEAADGDTHSRVLNTLRDAGYRITNQRKVILDIILNEDPSCCKEIYREAVKRDKNIGSATVYRMVNTLEELGLISRKNMYQVDCDQCSVKCDSFGEDEKEVPCSTCGGCNIVISTDDGQKLVIDRAKAALLIELGLKQSGEIAQNIKVTRIVM